jgi:16S rRNA (guanine527-N7)-methyltransferase
VHVTLLDRSEKKITFLRRVVASLRLENGQLCCSMAEDLAHRLCLQEYFDVVVSCGVGRVAHLIRLTAPLLKPEGRLLLRKPCIPLSCRKARLTSLGSAVYRAELSESMISNAKSRNCWISRKS